MVTKYYMKVNNKGLKQNLAIHDYETQHRSDFQTQFSLIVLDGTVWKKESRNSKRDRMLSLCNGVATKKLCSRHWLGLIPWRKPFNKILLAFGHLPRRYDPNC